MALKILGQVAPAGAALLFQTGAAEVSVISSIIACNVDTVSYNFTIHACIVGVAGDATNTIFKGTIPPGESFTAVAGVTLGNLDAIRVYSNAGAINKVIFTAFGDLS